MEQMNEKFQLTEMQLRKELAKKVQVHLHVYMYMYSFLILKLHLFLKVEILWLRRSIWFLCIGLNV